MWRFEPVGRKASLAETSCLVDRQEVQKKQIFFCLNEPGPGLSDLSFFEFQFL